MTRIKTITIKDMFTDSISITEVTPFFFKIQCDVCNDLIIRESVFLVKPKRTIELDRIRRNKYIAYGLIVERGVKIYYCKICCKDIQSVLDLYYWKKES